MLGGRLRRAVHGPGVRADGLRERTGQAGDEVALARVERRPPFGAEEAEHGPRLAVHAQRGPQLVGEARGLHEVAVASAPRRAVLGAHPQPGGRLLGPRQVADRFTSSTRNSSSQRRRHASAPPK